ncbi:MAG: aminotransferase class I/II-fold pyridoxal phosphate-dependent enzyme [Planctomycetota bacterium]
MSEKEKSLQPFTGGAEGPGGAEGNGSSGPAARGAGRTSLSRHYNASHMRADAWNRLKTRVGRLTKDLRKERDPERHVRGLGEDLALLSPIEAYWAYPGKRLFGELLAAFERRDYELLSRRVDRIVRMLVSDGYRRREPGAGTLEPATAEPNESEDGEAPIGAAEDRRPYFELLVVDEISEDEEAELRRGLLAMRRPEDDFVYDVVVVPSFEDALIAVLFNYNIQACMVRYGFPYHASNHLEILQRYVTIAGLDEAALEEMEESERSVALGRVLRKLRPELDLFLVTEAPVEEIAGLGSRHYRRVFYRQEDYRELHLSILKGIYERFDTPFFSALRRYTQKPTGVFHAMPISRGKSIAKSHWIQDMRAFYGDNIFLAETSATTGGLDSLLQPHGSLKSAMQSAARAFGAKRTFFVTNGTSTANKIVLQALMRPGEIILVSHDCHKSHHYSVLLSGALPIYMDPYPVSTYSMYGAVPLREIKRHLLALRSEGKLDRVRCLLLTNCTFDGVTYDTMRVMREVLAIKPDMIFLWDEAWFAFATFSPISRRRTAMDAAQRLASKLRTPAYRERYEAWRGKLDERGPSDEELLDIDLLPDPDLTRIRVYATQSTHKTLTALRQGSMIHIHDQDYERLVANAFHEAYMTHTSTSPNYQILASLDLGRRQVVFEGYELVQKSVELAMVLRERVRTDPLLSRHFDVLGPGDVIPAEYRRSGIEAYYDPESGWNRMEEAWGDDEFALDPTRITIACGRAGVDGDTFKQALMDRFDIQINKTSRNTVLFMIHIGMTRGTVAYLIDTLSRFASELEERSETDSHADRCLHEGRVTSLTQELPPLPNFSRFHDVYRPDREGETPEGDMRAAFYDGYAEGACEHLKLDGAVARELDSGRTVVSATFVTPYPPGFPVLVPGQIISREILEYLKALDVKEIHGYDPVHGLRVFTEEALQRREQDRVEAGTATPGA